MKSRLIVIMFLCVGLFLSGCTSSDQANSPQNDKVKNAEPVTLKINYGKDDDNFQKAFIESLKKKYPNITIEYVDGSYDDLITSHNIPDILWWWNRAGTVDAHEHQLTYDMTNLIKSSGFDLSRYAPNQLKEWQAVSDGEIWALPMKTSRFALMYNRDIFDLFGAPYPTDGMTWDEVIDLASKVTGTRDGVNYQGLYMPGHEAPIFWTTKNLIDPETNEPTWTSDPNVIDYFKLYKKAYSIKGNPYIPEHWEKNGWVDLFQKEQRLAMVAQFFGTPDPKSDVNWDIVTYPEPKRGVPSRGWAMGISTASKHKQEAMKVLKLWYQAENLMKFTGPVFAPYPKLYDNGTVEKTIKETKGDIWKGRNLDALFSLPVAEPPKKMSKYENDGIVTDALHEFAQKNDDINTFMRKKHQEEVTRIKEEMKKE